MDDGPAVRALGARACARRRPHVGLGKPFGFNTAWQAVPQQEPHRRADPLDARRGRHGLPRYTNATGGGAPLHDADERCRRARVLVVPPTACGDDLLACACDPHGHERSAAERDPRSHARAVLAVSTRRSSPGSSRPGQCDPVEAVSDQISTAVSVRAHQLTPGFAWTGDTDVLGNRSNAGLWRVYVFSDKQCVNPVLHRVDRRRGCLGRHATSTRSRCRGHRGVRPSSRRGISRAGAHRPRSSPQTATYPTHPSRSWRRAPQRGPARCGLERRLELDRRRVPARQPRRQRWPQGRYWWTVVPVRVVAVPPKGRTAAEARCAARRDPARVP